MVIRAPKWFRHNVRIVGDLHSANEISDFNGRSLVTTLDTDRLIFQGNLIVTGKLTKEVGGGEILMDILVFPP